MKWVVLAAVFAMVTVAFCDKPGCPHRGYQMAML